MDLNQTRSCSITKEEIKTTLTKLKNRKAHELDGITNEILNYGGMALLDELHTLLKKILSQEKFQIRGEKA